MLICFSMLLYIYYVFLFAVFESTIYTSFFKDYNTICIMNFLLFKCFTYMNYILEIMYIYIYINLFMIPFIYLHKIYFIYCFHFKYIYDFWLYIYIHIYMRIYSSWFFMTHQVIIHHFWIVKVDPKRLAYRDRNQ